MIYIVGSDGTLYYDGIDSWSWFNRPTRERAKKALANYYKERRDSHQAEATKFDDLLTRALKL